MTDLEVRRARAKRLQVVFVVAVVAAGLAVWIFTAMGAEDEEPSRPSQRYLEDRAFCEDRATDQARATDGMHSVGGNWWVDRVNECLLERD